MIYVHTKTQKGDSFAKPKRVHLLQPGTRETLCGARAYVPVEDPSDDVVCRICKARIDGIAKRAMLRVLEGHGDGALAS